MNENRRFLKRFPLTLIVSGIALILLNLALFIFFMSPYMEDYQRHDDPLTVAHQMSDALQKQDGVYHLDETKIEDLSQTAWAMLLQNGSTKVVWSRNLPDDFPQVYTLAQVSAMSTTYFRDYPTFTVNNSDGVLVVGYPKNSYFKLVNNYWPMRFIKNIPELALVVLLANALLLTLFYLRTYRVMNRSVGPLLEGISSLPKQQPLSLKEKGLLGNIACSLNQASELLAEQKELLNRRDVTRMNWITGVSHDIRTPLSIILGYADELKRDDQIPEESRKKMLLIRMESLRIKNLVNDLNLVSKLDYDSHFLHIEPVFPVKFLRGLIAEYLNDDFENHYNFEFFTEEKDLSVSIQGDANLLGRAVRNLIQNSIDHNPQGCKITVKLETEPKWLHITVADNGYGVSSEKLRQLKHTPHYMDSTDKQMNLRHGLGLMIVNKIVELHHGQVDIQSEGGHGFKTRLSFPLFEIKPQSKSSI